MKRIMELGLTCILSCGLLACDKPEDSPPTIEPESVTTNAQPPSTRFRVSQKITLQCTSNDAVTCNTTYYTLDGSEPTEQSARYAGPITIDKTTTLKYFSTDSLGNREAIQTQTYTVDTQSPKVAKLSPQEDAYNIPLRGAEFRIQFSEAMNVNTLTAEHIRISYRLGAIKGSVRYEAETNTAVYTPEERLMAGNKYLVEITPKVTDQAGNPMERYTYSVDTASIAWIISKGSLVKMTSAQEELIRLDEIDCKPLGQRTHLAMEHGSRAVWVADHDNNRLLKLDEFGDLLVQVPVNKPIGLSLDQVDGGLWLLQQALDGTYKLVKRSPLGDLITETKSGLPLAWDDATGANPITTLYPLRQPAKSPSDQAAMDWEPQVLWLTIPNSDANPPVNSSQQLRLHGANSAIEGYSLASALTEPVGKQHRMFTDLSAAGLALDWARYAELISKPWSEHGALDVSAVSMWTGGEAKAVKMDSQGTKILDAEIAEGAGYLRFPSVNIKTHTVWLGDVEGRIVKYDRESKLLVNQTDFAQPLETVVADVVDDGAWVSHGGVLSKLNKAGQVVWDQPNTHAQAILVQERYGVEVHVSESGNDESGDGTVSRPLRSLTKALVEAESCCIDLLPSSIAKSGDIIRIGPGVYNESVDIIQRDIKLLGAGAASTKIEGPVLVKGLNTAFSPGFSDFDQLNVFFVTLENLEIIRNHYYSAVDVRSTSNVVLRHNKLVNANGGEERIGSAVNGYFMVQTDYRFENNYADYPMDTMLVSGNVMDAFDIGVSVNYGHVIVRNNIITNGRQGIAIASPWSEITNNTISDMDATDLENAEPQRSKYNGGIFVYGNAKVSGNIIHHASNRFEPANAAGITLLPFVDQSGYDIEVPLDYAFRYEINHNLLANNTPGNFQVDNSGVVETFGENSYADPLFADPLAGDFHLQANSPATNAGPVDIQFDRGEACGTPNRRADLGAYGGPWALPD